MNKEGNEYNGSFYFLVDEIRYAEKDGHSGDSNQAPASSATINLQLNAGQLVRIENVGSTLLYGTHAEGFVQSWFTGHLLYAL